MIIPSTYEQSYSRTPQEVVYSQNKWCNFVFGSTFALYGLMADSLAGLGTRAHSSICAVGFKVLKYVLIDLCDKCGVCVMLSVSWVVNTHSYACLYDFCKSLKERGCLFMNKRCVALTDEQYRESISLLRSGFILDEKLIKPNERIAAVEVLQATLGLRLGDTLKLKMCSFIKDGSRYRLDIKEQKTGKMRTFTVPIEVYSFIQDYAISNNIGADAKLFDISERQVERHMNKVFTKMGLPLRQYGTHSARKLFATKVYVENDYNIELVRVLLQHSSVVTTQRYIGIQQKQVEDALAGTVVNLV